jgi:hypothetical protein
MHSLLWYLHPSTKDRKKKLTYYKTYVELIGLKNHVDADHAIIAKKFEEEVNNKIRGLVEKQLTKKRLNVSSIIISSFFVVKMFVKQMMCNT